jgi:hypothetical protein
MKHPLADLARRLRAEGLGLVAKHPPETAGAAVGRDRSALADEIERGLHNGWKMTVATSILVAALAVGDPLLPELQDAGIPTSGTPTISRYSAATEPPARSSEHIHSESDRENRISAAAVISAGARVVRVKFHHPLRALLHQPNSIGNA